jgi:ribosomal protein S14
MEKEHLGEYVQLDFFSLLPGSAGGRALRDLRGSEYFSELAKNAAAKKTREERQAIHKKGVTGRPIFVRVELSREKVREMTPEEILGFEKDRN